MAHSRLALTTMYDWIERCLNAGERMPDDAAICERYGFDSRESARTLLAELADAGRITIRGYGETRTIALGRQRSTLAPAPRPEPAIAKRDEDVERTAARIIEIAQRGRPLAAMVAASNAAKLLASVTPKPAAKKPAPPVQEEPVMPAKTIQIPASADDVIAAIEEHAKRNDVPLGLATASLVKRGLETAPISSAANLPAQPASLDDLLDLVRQRFDDRSDQSADIAVAAARAEAAEARATAAETKLARLKEALA